MNGVAHDTFFAINGPEDGAEWPALKPVVYLGRGTDCAVQVRLDAGVEAVHARANVEAGGYRVRSHRGAAVYVDGKKVTVLRSRILAPGSVLRIGDTELSLSAAADGQMKRSSGVRFDGDAMWMARAFLRGAGRLVRRIVAGAWTLPRLLRGGWGIVLILGIGTVLLVSPNFRAWAVYGFRWAVNSLSSLF